MSDMDTNINRRKFMKYLGIACASFAAAGLVGCGGGGEAPAADGGEEAPPAGGGESGLSDTLIYAQGADPRSLDPAFFDDGESAKPAGNIYEGLYRYADKNTDVLPALAVDYPDISDDGLIYTIKIHEGIKFHDGSDLTADVVKYSIERNLAPNVTEDMPYASFVFGSAETGTGVETVEVLDPTTIKITMRTASTPFIKNLAMGLAAPIVSQQAVEAAGGDIGESPVGTGPYKFISWIKSDNVRLEAFDGYWDASRAAKTKNVIFKVIPENATRLQALFNNEVDVIDGLERDQADQVQQNGFTLFSEDGMTINYMAFNNSDGVCTDVEVRKALAQAINVSELVPALYGQYASIATSVLPSNVKDWGNAIKTTAYDPDAARATLAAKGVTAIECIAYTNPRPYNAAGDQLAQMIQGYLQEVGVAMNITTYDWTTYKQKVQTDPFDVCFYGWTGDNGDPDNFMNLIADPNLSMNVAHVDDPEYKALINQGLLEEDGSEARWAVYQQCEQMVWDKQFWLPISHSKNLCGVNPKVHDFYYHPVGDVFLWQTSKDA